MKILDDNEVLKYDEINFVILDECHSVSADKFYDLLCKIKYTHKINIIGFSATPLRKNADVNLVNIFSKSNDKKEKEKKINLISCYDFMNAIKDDIILPPFYILCELKDSEDENKNRQILKNILKDCVKEYELPYNKSIGWCRTIENMKSCYEIFKSDYDKIYCSSYSDKQLKKLKYNTSLSDFYKEEENSMLICVNKCKEGSDIKNLDSAIYLDQVQNRSLLVSLQTMGCN